MNWLIAISPTAIFALILWLCRNLIVTRLTKSVQHEFDSKLEKIKADYTRDLSNYTSAFSSFQEGQKAAMEMKILAIQKIWNSILEIKKKLPIRLTITDILTRNEILNLIKNPHEYKKLTGEETLKKEDIHTIASEGVEDVRPFTNDYIFTIHFCYRAIFLRAALLQYGEYNKDNICWFDDNATKQIIKSCLSKEEFEDFDKLEFSKLSWLQRTLENKILSKMKDIVSGKEYTNNSLEEIKKIQEALAQASLAQSKIN